jgi:hypothetical protein
MHARIQPTPVRRGLELHGCSLLRCWPWRNLGPGGIHMHAKALAWSSANRLQPSCASPFWLQPHPELGRIRNCAGAVGQEVLMM